ACGGGDDEDEADLGADARTVIRNIAQLNLEDVEVAFEESLTESPNGVLVSHWDPSVPRKVPPLLDTEIEAHGLVTMNLDGGQLADVALFYPEGDGPRGYGVIADLAEPALAGPYHAVHLAVVSEVPIEVADETLLYEYAFAFDADGVGTNNYEEESENYFTGADRWYRVTWSSARNWRLEAFRGTTAQGADGVDIHTVDEVATAARVILTGLSVVLLVPASEFADATPDYRVIAFAHDGDFGIPAPHSWTGDVEPRLAEGLSPYPSQR
ncbi:MAG: hypothetical protein AAGD14_07200, partial [Planctomycetota bacterium]